MRQFGFQVAFSNPPVLVKKQAEKPALSMPDWAVQSLFDAHLAAGFSAVLLFFLFVFEYGAVEFVYQEVDGGVHIFVGLVEVQVFAGHMPIHFCFLHQFVHRQGNGGGNHVVAVADDAFEFTADVISQGFGNLDVDSVDFMYLWFSNVIYLANFSALSYGAVKRG